MSFSEFVWSRSTITSDAQVLGQLTEGMEQQEQGRPGYYYLTELTNLQQSYWERTGEAPEKPRSLLNAFERGKRVEWEVRAALEELDSYAEEEVELDGAARGIERVRGRADFRIDMSLGEIKNSPEDIQAPQHIWENREQDIEQILFYAGMWTYENNPHYLIYHIDEPDPILRCFKIEITDFGLVRNVLKQRRDRLDKMLNEYEPEPDIDLDPARGGKCRYFPCWISNADVCECEDLEELGLSGLDDAAEITRATDLEDRLEPHWPIGPDGARPPLWGWNLETPRQGALRLMGVYESGGQPPSTAELERAIYQSGMKPAQADIPSLDALELPLTVAVSRKWLQVERTTPEGSETRTLPARVMLWEEWRDGSPSFNNWKNWAVSLAVLCAQAGINTGYILVHAPEHNTNLYARRIVFDDLDSIQAEVRERVSAIAEAIEEEDLQSLPECPEWMVERELCDADTECLCISS